MLKIRDIEIGSGKPGICYPITAKNSHELQDQIEFLLSKEPDMIEWRVDFYQEENWIEALRKVRENFQNQVIIFTFRTLKEGGERFITDEDYRIMNEKAIDSDLVDIVDVELLTSEEIRKRIMTKAIEHNIHTIVSYHNFNKTPSNEDMIRFIEEEKKAGASIAKMAVMPENPSDLIRLLDVTNQLSNHSKTPIVTMAMGGIGLLSRLSGELFGSAITFASGINASAPGQINGEEMDRILNLIHKNLQS
ncbi:3-dehydroquinate dehydratase [Pelagirhabdus alkalitolerans]|uniref:3-dehydroquinate dehydratase n=1 Tax=Pelagirhabdus alkalitolerans TaxID=1612202 RepID=A0A1G6KB39_9BACI|nr:type I 3-dehydroquinate dehydratase [Pelagirhabdus alkalitolerans]SDC28282.1 3-dehydroquinate dehydratase [Pelagirhabdus alkalitolerans]